MINQFPLDLYMLHKLIRNFFYLIGLSTNRIFLKASVPREEEKEKGEKKKATFDGGPWQQPLKDI